MKMPLPSLFSPRRATALASLASLVVSAALLPAHAAMLQSAQVTATVNEVNVIEPTGGERVAKVQDQIRGEQGVRTGVKSRAELLFQDKTLTRLGASTIFTFTSGTRDLELESGTMLLQAPKGAGGARIRTAAVTAAITGTTILIEYSPAPWMKGAAKLPPGVSADVAKLDPTQAARELKKPSRAYSPADRAELQRRTKMSKKNPGYAKVMVLEGTLRLFLNTRIGESTLIKAGEMIILNPNAFRIPPPVEFDIARLTKTSLLVNSRSWGKTATSLGMVAVNREINAQSRQMRRGDLVQTNLVIPGGGTNVLAQIEQAATALSASAAPVAAPGNEAEGAENFPPSNFVTDPQGRGGPVAGLPGFQVEGSTTVVPDASSPPSSSVDLGGNFQTVTSLAGAVPVLPTEGKDFAIFSTGGQSKGAIPQDLTATKVTNIIDIPNAPAGQRVGLSFDYRFFTDEIASGAAFPDQFNVIVSAGDESIILALDRNALSPGGAGFLTPVAQAGVGGFVGGTDWLPFQIDLAPFLGKKATVSILIWDVGDAKGDSAFALDDFAIGTYDGLPGAPGIPGSLTLNLDSVTLGSAAGEYVLPNLEGLPARDNLGPAANTGSLVVNVRGAITVNGAINASTGTNGAGTTFGGRGGGVTLNSKSGTVTVNAPIKVSESATVGGKASAAGGSIKVASARTSGVAISINNTGELLALLNAAAPGPGGKIELSSAGGEIRVNGARLIADRGVIDVCNTGANGLVQLNAAQLAADVVKVGALGTNGQLTITAGSQLSAGSTLKLYGGSGDLGRVLFTGNGTVDLKGSPIHIAGKTVEISNATHVNNDGPTNVHTDNARFGVGAGGGNFGKPVNSGPLSGAPSFD